MRFKKAVENALNESRYAFEHETDPRQKDRRAGFIDALEWILSIS
jgi:hypothetical protein